MEKVEYSAYKYGRRRGGREITDDSTGRGYLGNELIRVVLNIITARDEILETEFYDYTKQKLQLYVWFLNQAPFHQNA